MNRKDSKLIAVKNELRELLDNSYDCNRFSRENPIYSYSMRKNEHYSVYGEHKFNHNDFSQDDKGGQWYELPGTLSGDYAGSYIGKANRLAILNEFDGNLPTGIIEVISSYSTSQLYANPSLCNLSTLEFLTSYVRMIENYPILDDEILYEIENELKEESIELYTQDFAKEIDDIYGDTLPDDTDIWYLIDEIDVEDLLREVIYVCEHEGNFESFIMQDNDAYLDVSKLVQETLQPEIARKLRKIQSWQHIMMIELSEAEKMESLGHPSLFDLKEYNT